MIDIKAIRKRCIKSIAKKYNQSLYDDFSSLMAEVERLNEELQDVKDEFSTVVFGDKENPPLVVKKKPEGAE